MFSVIQWRMAWDFWIRCEVIQLISALSIQVWFEMKNQGITPNAVTYGYYNRVRRLLSIITAPSGALSGEGRGREVFLFPFLLFSSLSPLTFEKPATRAISMKSCILTNWEESLRKRYTIFHRFGRFRESQKVSLTSINFACRLLDLDLPHEISCSQKLLLRSAWQLAHPQMSQFHPNKQRNERMSAGAE